MSDLISVIVPVYNGQKYINRCIRSIVSQEYANLEVIIVNDGSTDQTAFICDEWAKKDKRIKVIHKKNQGVSAARNSGIKAASGKYIGFVDADDMIDRRMYDILHKNIIENDCDVSICEYNILSNGTVINRNVNRARGYEGFLSAEQCVLNWLLHHRGHVYCWNKLFKAEIFTKIKFRPDIVMGEDMILFNKVIAHGYSMHYCIQPLYFYQSHDDSANYNEHKVFKDGRITFLTVREILLEIHKDSFLRNCIDKNAVNILMKLCYKFNKYQYRLICLKEFNRILGRHKKKLYEIDLNPIKAARLRTKILFHFKF